jgi:hypothetical protein
VKGGWKRISPARNRSTLTLTANAAHLAVRHLIRTLAVSREGIANKKIEIEIEIKQTYIKKYIKRMGSQ